MPLLPPEPYIFPDTLLEAGVPSDGTSDRRWWVLHTRPRAEKSLARAAFESSIPFFLPVYTRRWCSGRRVFAARLPLFTGYFFLHGAEDERERLLETRSVAHCLAVLDQTRLQADLARIYELMRRGAAVRPEDRLTAGARVRITDGPMRSMEGKVIRQGSKLRLVVEVDFLRKGVSVEVESWMVTALPRESRYLVRV